MNLIIERKELKEEDFYIYIGFLFHLYLLIQFESAGALSEQWIMIPFVCLNFSVKKYKPWLSWLGWRVVL